MTISKDEGAVLAALQLIWDCPPDNLKFFVQALCISYRDK
jgi:hypothetical protein